MWDEIKETGFDLETQRKHNMGSVLTDTLIECKKCNRSQASYCNKGNL